MKEESPEKSKDPRTFEGAAEAQFQASRRATPLQRLLWLESAVEFAYAAGALPWQKETTSSPESGSPAEPKS